MLQLSPKLSGPFVSVYMGLLHLLGCDTVLQWGRDVSITRCNLPHLAPDDLVNGVGANPIQGSKCLGAMGLGSKYVVVSDLVDLAPSQFWLVD